MFTNKKINNYTYETRFIASWLKAGGQLTTGEDIDNFRNWLISLELEESEVAHIVYLATTGKLELEGNAKRFLNTQAE